MSIFQPIAPPPKQARLSINREATWYTWSREFRLLFKAWSRQVGTMKGPVSIRLFDCVEYDDTYSLDINSISNKGLVRDLLFFARKLYDLNISDRLMLFTDLIDQDLCGRSLRFLFAFLRDALVSFARDPLAAFYQPLSTSQKEGTDFPLHSDLYVPVILFNVFEDVRNDSSGASIFLPVSSLNELFTRVKTLPVETRKKIIENLTGIHEQDRYEENYYLLHGWAHEWTEDLGRRMRQQQLRIKLYSGQGYMIHDRKWLHGREALNCKLSKKRLHRLIFNTRQAQRASIRRRTTFRNSLSRAPTSM
jgi:hypothetical protein